MNKQTREFMTCLTLEGLDSVEDFGGLCARLVDVSKKLQALEVAECNRELSERERFNLDHFRTAAQVYAKSLGLKVTVCGDPRGHVVKVELPSGRSNHMGGGTWGVLG